MVETVSEARKALVKAIWSCIVDASSMNVVMSGPEVNAAMDGYRAAVLRELREEVADLSEWLSTCRCFVINPKFGEGQPGGHFTDCAWAQESNVRDEILAAIDRRLGG